MAQFLSALVVDHIWEAGGIGLTVGVCVGAQCVGFTLIMSLWRSQKRTGAFSSASIKTEGAVASPLPSVPTRSMSAKSKSQLAATPLPLATGKGLSKVAPFDHTMPSPPVMCMIAEELPDADCRDDEAAHHDSRDLVRAARLSDTSQTPAHACRQLTKSSSQDGHDLEVEDLDAV